MENRSPQNEIVTNGGGNEVKYGDGVISLDALDDSVATGDYDYLIKFLALGESGESGS